MSLHHPETVTCPECQHQQQVEIWQTLNAGIDPEAVERLKRGEINTFQCEQCGLGVGIDAPLVYHDMQLELYVQYIPWPMVEQGSDFLNNYSARGLFQLPESVLKAMPIAPPEYMQRQHVVFSMLELVQYVIFRETLAEREAAQ